jgi:hypothetical protein
VHNFVAPFTSLSKLSKSSRAKPAKLAYFDFSSFAFNVQGHILSTSGDALKSRYEGIYLVAKYFSLILFEVYLGV